MSSHVEPQTDPILQEGATCWRTARAERLSFLVDGEEYFDAIAETLERAQHEVWLLGWDFHSEVSLRRGPDGERTSELVALLDRIVRERASLNVYVIAWDFALLYALEREFLPLLQFGVRTHPRVHFTMDAAYPATASQHQKLVVVDRAVGFVGGFDLTTHRWDTRQHRPNDPNRVTPAGKPYQPFHDVQVAVSGPAAAVLADLARGRWERATGRPIAEPAVGSDPWPPDLSPHARDVDVGIARTFPATADTREIREVESLYQASIAAAKQWIYIENQYLTAPRITDWLAARLREPDGPEVVFVGPRHNAGWLEQNTMGALRDRALRTLQEADHADRLRLLYPHRSDLSEDEIINVHSKVMVIDDAFARVGSSNLSNRSLGFDTECDLAFESSGREDLAASISALRSDLLAEHLGTTADRVEDELRRSGSLVGTVDALSGGDRTLCAIEIGESELTAEAIDAIGAIDPEHPVPLEELVRRFEEDGVQSGSRGSSNWIAVAAGVALVALFVAWNVTPLSEWVAKERLAEALAVFQDAWYGPVAATAIFVVASLFLVPVTALTVAAGFALGPVTGIGVAWIGSICSAAIGHFVGRRAWREGVRRLAGRRLNALSRRLAQRGILSSALVRVVPIAPFTVVNLVAGASHMGARDFIIGTALGILPGTVLLVLAADGIGALLREPSAGAWVGTVGAIAALIAASVAAKRWLAHRSIGSS